VTILSLRSVLFRLKNETNIYHSCFHYHLEGNYIYCVFTGLDWKCGEGKHYNSKGYVYPGKGEEALINYLQNESNSTFDRTHVAIWTLGQINSEKALPLLKKYTNKSCYGNHDEYLCQYEVYKAITAIENNRLFSFARLRTP